MDELLDDITMARGSAWVLVSVASIEGDDFDVAVEVGPLLDAGAAEMLLAKTLRAFPLSVEGLSFMVNTLRERGYRVEPQRAMRPTITVLCGSTRFYDAFQEANYRLTMEGHIVLSVGFYPHASAEHGHGEGVGHDGAEKVALDELHKRKIDLADSVLVLNVDGYIGESTRSEIVYARNAGKPVAYLHPESTRMHLHSSKGLCLPDVTEPIGKTVDHCNQRTGYEMISHVYQPKCCDECLRIRGQFRACHA